MVRRVVAVVECSAERLCYLGRKSSELFRLEVIKVGINYIDACARYNRQA